MTWEELQMFSLKFGGKIYDKCNITFGDIEFYDDGVVWIRCLEQPLCPPRTYKQMKNMIINMYGEEKND